MYRSPSGHGMMIRLRSTPASKASPRGIFGSKLSRRREIVGLGQARRKSASLLQTAIHHRRMGRENGVQLLTSPLYQLRQPCNRMGKSSLGHRTLPAPSPEEMAE